jgi:hypothetical protein
MRKSRDKWSMPHHALVAQPIYPILYPVPTLGSQSKTNNQTNIPSGLGVKAFISIRRRLFIYYDLAVQRNRGIIPNGALSGRLLYSSEELHVARPLQIYQCPGNRGRIFQR